MARESPVPSVIGAILTQNEHFDNTNGSFESGYNLCLLIVCL